MRILVHEFATGGGFPGPEVPAALAREGAAMRDALIADLAALGGHSIVTTMDPRFPVAARPHVDVVPVRPGAPLSKTLIRSADAVWLIAPETAGCLERLARRVERSGTMLLGSGAVAIRRAADKQRLARRLAGCGVVHPRTHALNRRADAKVIAAELGFPVVVKPVRGAGCEGVGLARKCSDLLPAIRSARKTGAEVAQAFRPATAALEGRATQDVLLQQYVSGIPASVSLLCDGRRSIALSVNAQAVRTRGPFFSYHGGRTPFDHPLAARAIEMSQRACRALVGLRGYVGVDLVLTDSEAIVIEVNPRLTTAYLGVRSAFAGNGRRVNIPELAIAACHGELPAVPRAHRCVRFTSAGRIVADQ
jgi:tyramine---L-glutamate ligase